ncbi:MAG: DUF4124 domain-containing protein [Pseudomonadota bacterium]
MKYLLLIILLYINQNTFAASIYKCINKIGNTVFSDEPCSKKAKRIKIKSFTNSKTKSQKRNKKVIRNLKREKESILVALSTEGLPDKKRVKFKKRVKVINKKLNQ